VLGTWVSCAKTDEPIVKQFGSDSCEPKELCVDVVRIPHGKGQFWWGTSACRHLHVALVQCWHQLSSRTGCLGYHTAVASYSSSAACDASLLWPLVYASVVLLNSSGVLHAGGVAVHFNKHRVAQKVYIFNTPYFWNRSREREREFIYQVHIHNIYISIITMAGCQWRH